MHTILIDCPDQKGLVHNITGALLTLGLNIDSQDEFVEPTESHFFIRTVVSGNTTNVAIENALASVLPSDATCRIGQAQKKNIIVFASKEPHCLGDLLLRHDYGELNAHILAVVSNHSSLAKLVQRFDIPFHHLPVQSLEREAHEATVLSLLTQYDFDYLVLAKYMRILTPGFVRRFSQRLINIHHSFLPAFIGANPYHEAFKRGVKIIGATAHFVTADLDQGPIIAQDIAPVTHRHSVDDMIRAGRNVEKIVLANALRLVFEERVLVKANRTIIFD